MKRTPFSILGFFLAIFTFVTFMNSCEVEHFYEAEITVVNAEGEPKPGFTVTTTVDVDADYEPFREGVTNDIGKVYFSYKNIAILKVQADSIVEGGNDYHGEALIVLEEDKIVPITVVVY
tara:strand:+ start:158 stop:517 length:360 start_codon:yes stop_codon:yes gene_type:complete